MSGVIAASDKRMRPWKALAYAFARAPHSGAVVLTTNLQGWSALSGRVVSQAA